MFLIKQYREEAGMTQKQLAEQIKVTVEYISYLENGQRTPSITLLENIAKVLKTSIKELIKD